MNTALLQKIEKPYLKTDVPFFEVGDKITVTYKIIEEKKEKERGKDKDKEDKVRTQKFTGLVIAKKSSGLTSTMTVRKISHGVGVEKIMLMHSPIIVNIELVKKNYVTKSKLYYMRERVGKAALKVGKEVINLEDENSTETLDEVKE